MKMRLGFGIIVAVLALAVRSFYVYVLMGLPIDQDVDYGGLSRFLVMLGAGLAAWTFLGPVDVDVESGVPSTPAPTPTTSSQSSSQPSGYGGTDADGGAPFGGGGSGGVGDGGD